MGEDMWAQMVRKVEKVLVEDGEDNDWHRGNSVFCRATKTLWVLGSDGSRILSQCLQCFLLVAFLQEVSLDPTDGIWSELQLCYITESFLGLARMCHHSAGKASSTVEAAAIAQSSFWACSFWRCDLSPIGVLSCVTVICTSCFSVSLGESPKVVIWVFVGVCSLST